MDIGVASRRRHVNDVVQVIRPVHLVQFELVYHRVSNVKRELGQLAVEGGFSGFLRSSGGQLHPSNWRCRIPSDAPLASPTFRKYREDVSNPGTPTASPRLLKLTPELKERVQKVATTFGKLHSELTNAPHCDFLHVGVRTRRQLDVASDAFLLLAAFDPDSAKRLPAELLDVAQTFSDLKVTFIASVSTAEPSVQPAQVDSCRAAETGQAAGQSAPAPVTGNSIATEIRPDSLRGADDRLAPVPDNRNEESGISALPLGSATALGDDTERVRDAQRVIEQIKECAGQLQHISPRRAPVRLWRLAKRMNDLLANLGELERQGVRLVRENAGRPTAPIQAANMAVVGLGPVSTNWLTVSLQLAVAMPLVSLCREIAQANTGAAEWLISRREYVIARTYLRVFLDCRPSSYRVPVDESDFIDPGAAAVQERLDEFLPALRAFLNHAFAQTVRPNSLTDGPQGEKPGTDKVRLRVNSSFMVFRNGQTVRPRMQSRAALGLIVLTPEGEDKTTIQTPQFAELTYRDIGQPPGPIWGRNKGALEKLGLKVECIRDREHKVSGYSIFLDEGVTRDGIRAYLKSKQPA